MAPEVSEEVEATRTSRQTAHEGGKAVSPRHRPPLPPANIPGTHLCLRLSRLKGHSEAVRFKSMKNPNDSILNRIRDLLRC
jgi:hypothetical protein